MIPDASPILEVDRLSMHYPIRGGLLRRRKGYVYAVNDVSFSIHRGETVGLVGESGCGKSTVARCILNLQRVTSGEVRVANGNSLSPVAQIEGEALRKFRRTVQIVFQDPYSSLDSRMRVRDIVSQPLKIHGIGDRESRTRRAQELLDLVGLGREHLHRFPHEFSGGQRQRIGLARALALEPSVLICDEPVSALDVSIQAQMLNLLKDLQQRLGLTYLFIAHDLSVVDYVSDRILVMYLGTIVESAPADRLYTRPLHPYTSALLQAIPAGFGTGRTRRPLEGGLPDAKSRPVGCPFADRCPFAREICHTKLPPLRAISPVQAGNGAGTHQVACHFAEELSLPGAGEPS